MAALTFYCQRALTPAVLIPPSRLSPDQVNKSENGSQAPGPGTPADIK